MPQPLYFLPDPTIPDALQLGYGDLQFDDGHSEFLNGEPDLASAFPLPPMGPPQAPQMPPPADLGGGLSLAMDGTILGPDGQPALAPGATPGGAMAGLGASVGQPMPEPPPEPPAPDMSGLAGFMPPAQQGEESWRQSVGQDMTGAPLAPQAPPLGAGGGVDPAAMAGQPLPGAEPQQGNDGQLYVPTVTGEWIPYQREGALPPDVAQRQLGELQQAQQQAQQQVGAFREQAGRIVNEATLAQMAQIEAQRYAQEEQIREQQQKVERWQAERQQVESQEFETGLVAAKGPVGAFFAVVGAALLSGAGRDTGLRMIDQSIQRHVELQVKQRNSVLGRLAEQIGSSQEAIALGKAQLYKIAASRAEALAQKTKNDVFMAQTPEVMATLEQKHTEQMQEAERLSLGKTIERTPAPPKPPSPEMLERYGKHVADREGSALSVQRIEQQLNLRWVPGKGGQPGHYANKAEVLKKGIPGIGPVDSFLPDAIFQLASADGYQIRGAVEALAYAQVRQMQPTGPISNVDAKVGQLAAAMRTDEGLLQGIERLRIGEEREKMRDAARFGPDVVAEYERRFRASGGTMMQTTPAASAPAALQEIQAERQRRRAPEGGPQARSAIPEPTREELQNAVRSYAETAGLNPDAVSRVIGHESGGKPGAVNKLTNKHAGLIQFSKKTWASLAQEQGTPDVTWDDMRKMSAEEQLPYVMLYFSKLGLGPSDDPGQYALGAFMPIALHQPDDFVLGRKGSKESIGGLSMHKVWEQNPGLRNGDMITAGDVRRSVL